MLKHLDFNREYHDFMSRIYAQDYEYEKLEVFCFSLINIPESLNDGVYNHKEKVVNMDITEIEYTSLCKKLKDINIEYLKVKDIIKSKDKNEFNNFMNLRLSIAFPDFYEKFLNLRKEFKKYISRYYLDTSSVCGNFNVISGKIYVADPCYNLDIKNNCSIYLNAENGKWIFTAYKTYSNGIGCSCLEICHNDYIDRQDMVLEDYINVDSAKAGFFCSSMYIKDNFETWYNNILSSYCEQDKHMLVSCFERGVMSKTFYGDGSYPIYISKNKKDKVVKAKIVYFSF